MPFWMREFENKDTGQLFRVYCGAEYLPSLRQQVADQQKDPRWLDDTIYVHDAGLDIKRDGDCPLKVELIP